MSYEYPAPDIVSAGNSMAYVRIETELPSMRQTSIYTTPSGMSSTTGSDTAACSTHVCPHLIKHLQQLMCSCRHLELQALAGNPERLVCDVF